MTSLASPPPPAVSAPAAGTPRPKRLLRRVLPLAAALQLAGCGSGAGSGEAVRITVPYGAAFSQVSDSLASHDIVGSGFLFQLYARARGATGSIQPGTYSFRPGEAWSRILQDLRAGNALTVRLVIPEGWDLTRIAPRLAEVTGTPPDTILQILADSATADRLQVPGPTLEGYLYPATYSFGVGAPLDTVLQQMVAAYHRAWTPARLARADSIGMSERAVVTLASIVEKEAKVPAEMPTIAAVYHNRLRIGMALQADPTVQYALGRHQSRLFYSQIDSVADNPYNTYRHPGLPPGPIGAPSERAIDAALWPADAPYLYFVARPDGTHVFSSSLEAHNRAKAAIRRAGSSPGKP